MARLSGLCKSEGIESEWEIDYFPQEFATADTAESVIRPDSKGRINLGKRTAGVSGYKVTDMGGGSLMLTAMAEKPAREIWLYKNPEAHALHMVSAWDQDYLKTIITSTAQ